MALRTRIREFRARDNLTQEDLARLVGVRRETIVHLEKGDYNPSLKLAVEIARVFGTTVETLFSFTDD
ncbi:MAG: helix-turn-helix transcriptional regulator [Sphingomonadaceae bacterium]